MILQGQVGFRHSFLGYPSCLPACCKLKFGVFSSVQSALNKTGAGLGHLGTGAMMFRAPVACICLSGERKQVIVWRGWDRKLPATELVNNRRGQNHLLWICFRCISKHYVIAC